MHDYPEDVTSEEEKIHNDKKRAKKHKNQESGIELCNAAVDKQITIELDDGAAVKPITHTPPVRVPKISWLARISAGWKKVCNSIGTLILRTAQKIRYGTETFLEIERKAAEELETEFFRYEKCRSFLRCAENASIGELKQAYSGLVKQTRKVTTYYEVDKRFFDKLAEINGELKMLNKEPNFYKDLPRAKVESANLLEEQERNTFNDLFQAACDKAVVLPFVCNPPPLKIYHQAFTPQQREDMLRIKSIQLELVSLKIKESTLFSQIVKLDKVKTKTITIEFDGVENSYSKKQILGWMKSEYGRLIAYVNSVILELDKLQKNVRLHGKHSRNLKPVSSVTPGKCRSTFFKQEKNSAKTNACVYEAASSLQKRA